MRAFRAATLVALLLVGSVAGVPVDASHGRTVTVDGTVTGVDGAPADDAAVLLGDDATLTSRSPTELRAAATDPPRDLTVVETGPDGRFETRLGSRRAEAAVAVSDAGVSDLAYVRGENATLSLRLHERRPQTVHAHVGAVAAGERRADLFVSLGNSGDAAVENLTVTVVGLPEGWTVAGVTTNGTYRPSTRTLRWSSVAPGAEIDRATVEIRVPEGTPPGEYAVELRAASDTHRVDVASATETVEVLPADTPGPTTMPPRGADGESTTGAVDGTTTDGPARTDGSPTAGVGAGLGVVVALVALGLGAALVGRRT